MPVHPRAYGEHQWPSVRVWMRSGLRDLCISFLITHKTHPTLGGGSEWVACSPKRRRGVGQDRRALRDGGEMTSHGEHLGSTGIGLLVRYNDPSVGTGEIRQHWPFTREF